MNGEIGLIRQSLRFGQVKMRLAQSTDRQGAATVEAAIMLPILVVVLLVSTDFAQYINLAQSVTNSSRQGARMASRSTTESVELVDQAILDFFIETFPNTPQEVLCSAIVVEVRGDDGKAILGRKLNEVESGDPVAVLVKFDFDSVRWFNGLDYLGNEVRSSITIARRE